MGAGSHVLRGQRRKYFVVQADLADYSHLADNIVRQPTVILYTDAKAHPEDLTVDFSFPPGTSAEDAIAEAGYDIV